ncbi:MAG: cobaltochelatase CobT-related protein [Nocardioidaceae bacterium]
MTATDRVELRAASIRALSADPSVHLRGGRVFRGDRYEAITAPHLHVADTEDVAAARGAADGVALRLLHSDAALHAQLLPADGTARRVFEMLEQFRVESVADRDMPGVPANLRERHLRWSLAYQASGLTESSSGLLLYTVAQICRSRVTREPVVEQTEDLLEATRAELSPHIGHAVAGLHPSRRDQERYAAHARLIAEHVATMIGDDLGDATGDDQSVLTLYIDPDEATGPGASSRRRHPIGSEHAGYHVFTTAYDRECTADDLVRPEQLDDYRRRLDERVAASGINVRRLARDLHRLLREPLPYGWSGGHEEGYVDGRRLSRLVTSPDQRDLFSLPGVQHEPRCQVSVLVDCSGSMKTYAEQVSVFVDVLAHALDLAGCGSEVLGFTTGGWNGGRALDDWHRAGRPDRPGRLNELCHLVMRDPDVSWRRGRRGLAAMLRSDLFREGVDGEAVSWACRRMSGLGDVRRILLVVSDGSPMDSATARANGPDYLDDHLRHVIDEQERRGVEVIGVGVGLELSAYYSRSLLLDLSNGLGMRSFRDLLALIGRPAS